MTDQLSWIMGGGTVQLLLDLLHQVRKWEPNISSLAKKAALLGCAVRTWRAVVPWQDMSQKKRKEMILCDHQEDVLRDGWSVEVEAAQARVFGPRRALAALWSHRCDATVQLIGLADQK